MQKMTKEELLKHLEPLGWIMNLTGTHIYPKWYQDRSMSLAYAGIELIEEKPAITIKNLGLFMAKFGEYPEASFTSRSSQDGVRLYRGFLKALVDSGFEDESGESWLICKIRDDRWTAENLKEVQS